MHNILYFSIIVFNLILRMVKTFLIIGGNLGNRYQNIEKAKEYIQEMLGDIVKQSSIYETEPWGFEHEQHFNNQVLEVNTTLDPYIMLGNIHKIEEKLGRKRVKGCYIARTMDIDILFYGNEIIRHSALIIPHAAVAERKFVLVPLAEIAPDFIHPAINKSISTLKDECKDKSSVKKMV